LVFLAATAAATGAMRTRLDWRIALVPAFALLPVMALLGLASVFELPHPFARYGWLAWSLAFVALGRNLRRHEAETPALARWMHVIALWLAVALTCWEVAWWIDQVVQGRGTWPFVAWALVPALVLLALAKIGDRLEWPLAKHREAYLMLGGAPMALYLWCWVFLANALSDGNPAPLPYVPLAGISYRLEPMLRSTLVQTCFSVFWTVLALGAMLLATRRGLRVVWSVGAALLAVVMGKLFIVDLSRVDGIERIVSFIVVGILLLAVGYFSPVPPRQSESGT
jgi:hypothetical protein